MIGAAAGGLLGGLGRLLEPLDAPRQALWNLPGAISRGDWMPALAGAGVLGGSLLTALAGPVGLPMLLGSGIQQYLGSTDQDEAVRKSYEAPTPSALLAALGGDPDSFAGQLASFGLGAVGDPLMWTGMGLGGKLGPSSRMGGEALTTRFPAPLLDTAAESATTAGGMGGRAGEFASLEGRPLETGFRGLDESIKGRIPFNVELPDNLRLPRAKFNDEGASARKALENADRALEASRQLRERLGIVRQSREEFGNLGLPPGEYRNINEFGFNPLLSLLDEGGFIPSLRRPPYGLGR